MNIPEIIAYIAIGYFFVTLTVLYVLSMSNVSIEKKGGESRKDRDIYKEDEEYLKAA
ncbi:MAG: hypothetical protein AABZ07_01345 [Nitrospirota bacterium]